VVWFTQLGKGWGSCVFLEEGGRYGYLFFTGREKGGGEGGNRMSRDAMKTEERFAALKLS